MVHTVGDVREEAGVEIARHEGAALAVVKGPWHLRTPCVKCSEAAVGPSLSREAM